KREPAGRPAAGKRVRSRLLRDAGFPVELRPSVPAKLGNDLAQFGMDPGAVVALVVVLEDHLPVGGDLIFLSPARAKLLERVLYYGPRHRPQLLAKCLGTCTGFHEDESAPTVGLDLMQAELVLLDLDIGCVVQLAVQPVSPRMIRAAD